MRSYAQAPGIETCIYLWEELTVQPATETFLSLAQSSWQEAMGAAMNFTSCGTVGPEPQQQVLNRPRQMKKSQWLIGKDGPGSPSLCVSQTSNISHTAGRGRF